MIPRSSRPPLAATRRGGYDAATPDDSPASPGGLPRAARRLRSRGTRGTCRRQGCSIARAGSSAPTSSSSIPTGRSSGRASPSSLYDPAAHARVAAVRVDPAMTLEHFHPNYSPAIAFLFAPLAGLRLPRRDGGLGGAFGRALRCRRRPAPDADAATARRSRNSVAGRRGVPDGLRPAALRPDQRRVTAADGDGRVPFRHGDATCSPGSCWGVSPTSRTCCWRPA